MLTGENLACSFLGSPIRCLNVQVVTPLKLKEMFV